MYEKDLNTDDDDRDRLTRERDGDEAIETSGGERNGESKQETHEVSENGRENEMERERERAADASVLRISKEDEL